MIFLKQDTYQYYFEKYMASMEAAGRELCDNLLGNDKEVLDRQVSVDVSVLEACRDAYLAFCYDTMGAVPDVNHPLTDSSMINIALEICREHYASLLENLAADKYKYPEQKKSTAPAYLRRKNDTLKCASRDSNPGHPD